MKLLDYSMQDKAVRYVQQCLEPKYYVEHNQSRSAPYAVHDQYEFDDYHKDNRLVVADAAGLNLTPFMQSNNGDG